MTLPLAGAKIKAADLATIFPTNTDAWTPYTPAWTSSGVAPALGNGVAQGKYMKIGRTVHCRGVITFGTTSTFGTGFYFISLPVAWLGDLQTPTGPVWVRDTSAGFDFLYFAAAQTTTTFLMRRGAGTASIVAPADPVTLASTDWISWSLTYEAAS